MQKPVPYPRPQWLRELEGSPFVLDAQTSLQINGELDGETGFFKQRLQDEYGLSLPTQPWDETGAAIRIGLLGDGKIRSFLTRCSVALDGREEVHEGYLLRAGPEGVSVAGQDRAGVFYGLLALSQLIPPDGNALTVSPVEIHDWPYKSIRGVHMYMPPRKELAFFRRFLETMASLRLNTLFLEVGGGMRFDRHPEINRKWEEYVHQITTCPGGVIGSEHGFPFPKDSTHYELAGGSYLEKDEVRQMLEWAQALHIEVLPEVQSLSHSYYLVYAHPEIAENSADPFPDTYCPSNPRSYELLFDVMDEVIEVFQPRLMHTGHDELYTLGLCPRCKGKDNADLLAGDLNKIHDYLAGKGVRMSIWGDKLMNIIVGGRPQGGREITIEPHAWFNNSKPIIFPETYPAVDRTPRDILILNWFWNIDPLAHQYFSRQGFEQILGNLTFHGPSSMPDWQEPARMKTLLGGEVSTWCEVSEQAFGHNAILFNSAFAAEALWWEHYSNQRRSQVLERLAALQPRLRSRLGAAQLPSLARRKMHKSYPLPATGLDSAIRGLPVQTVDFLETPFMTAAGEVNAQQVDQNSPSAAPVVIQGHAHSLVFLHHCLCQRKYYTTYDEYYIVMPTPEGLLGWYTITYADETEEKVEIRFGETIANWNVHFGGHYTACCYWAEPAWEGEDEGGRPVTLYRYEWVNPHPEKEILSVQLNSAGGEGKIRLAAVTGISL